MAAGTVLDPATAREVILHGGSVIVNPAVVPDVIDMANRYCVPVYSGAFTATEVLAGDASRRVDDQDIPRPTWRAEVHDESADGLPGSQSDSLRRRQSGNGGRVHPLRRLRRIGARTFMDREKIAAEGIGWITGQVARYVEIVRKAKENLPELP